MKLKIKFPTEKKGGPGSGHHGHSGRPGKHGGSAPGSGGGSVSGGGSNVIRGELLESQIYRVGRGVYQVMLQIGGENFSDAALSNMAHDYASEKLYGKILSDEVEIDDIQSLDGITEFSALVYED